MSPADKRPAWALCGSGIFGYSLSMRNLLERHHPQPRPRPSQRHPRLFVQL